MPTRPDSGFTVVELAVVGFLASVLLTSLIAFLMSSFNIGAFTEGQAFTINDVRNVLQQIEKETRGAEHLDWCAADGSCIEVLALQGEDGDPGRLVRYLHVATDLQRQQYNWDSGAWSDPHTLIQRVANTPEQPLFACDTQSTLLRVVVDLYVEPTPQSDPTFHLQTSFRPRNYPSIATCPSGGST